MTEPQHMTPIPETSAAEDEYGPFYYEGHDLLAHLDRIGRSVRSLAPTCVGLSLSMVEQDVTFTMVATDPTTALLDAVQYVDGGPCQDAVAEGADVRFRSDDPLAEERWSAFAAATSASGVSSTLSLPVVVDGVTVAGFNLYGSETDTFEGLAERMADLLGAWAPGAIADADLSFSTREIARRAPEVLRTSTRLTLATALLARVRGLSLEQAEERLREAAVRAAVPLPGLVESMIHALGVGTTS